MSAAQQANMGPQKRLSKKQERRTTLKLVLVVVGAMAVSVVAFALLA